MTPVRAQLAHRQAILPPPPPPLPLTATDSAGGSPSWSTISTRPNVDSDGARALRRPDLRPASDARDPRPPAAADFKGAAAHFKDAAQATGARYLRHRHRHRRPEPGIPD